MTAELSAVWHPGRELLTADQTSCVICGDDEVSWKLYDIIGELVKIPRGFPSGIAYEGEFCDGWFEDNRRRTNCVAA